MKLIVALFVLAPAVVMAQSVTPSTDISSNWGWGWGSGWGSGSGNGEPTVQAAINKAGFTTNVKKDAVSLPGFDAGTYNVTSLYQYASYAPNAKVGVYSLADPSNISWVLGGSNTGVGSGSTITESSSFGLVLDSGDKGGHGDTLYYQNPALNWGEKHLDLFTTSVNGSKLSNDYIGSWEDQPLHSSDKDYNDFGFRIAKTQSVPEPVSVIGIGIAAVALLRRRKKS